MSSFTCCIWWFVFGVLLGWLLSWWLSKCCGKKSCDNSVIEDDSSRSQNLMDSSSTSSYTPSTPRPAPVTSSTPAFSRADMIKAAQAVGISFSGRKSDLEIIEGIGPKIAELLNDNGVNTFEELSRASIPSINSILESGGDKFRLANPETWAEQAALAAQNKWAELKALQDSLDGGVRKS